MLLLVVLLCLVRVLIVLCLRSCVCCCVDVVCGLIVGDNAYYACLLLLSCDWLVVCV